MNVIRLTWLSSVLIRECRTSILTVVDVIISINSIDMIDKMALVNYLARRFPESELYLTESSLGDSDIQVQLENLFEDLGYKLGLSEVLRLPLKYKVEKLVPVLLYGFVGKRAEAEAMKP